MTTINMHSNLLWLGAGIAVVALGAGDLARAQIVVGCDEFGGGCAQFLPDARNDGTATRFSSLLVQSNQQCVGDLADAVTATVDIDHTWVGDLVITLTSPAGNPPVTLLDRLDNPRMPTVSGGCDGNLGRATFGDSGPAQNCFSFSREINPDPLFASASGTMSDLVDGTIAGIWQLTITDAAPGNFGELHGWSLAFDCDSIEDDRVFGDSFEVSP